MANELITINQNSKSALTKSKNLLNITNEILERNNSEWCNTLLNWAENNIVQEGTYFPSSKKELLETKKITLRWNRLKEIPNELFNLKDLETLELNNNAIEYLPQNIEMQKNLQELNLNINSLKNLPKEIIKLKNLKVLNIKNNKYLELSNEQISWLKELKNNGCKVIYDKYKFNIGE